MSTLSTAALDGALTNAREGWRQFPVNDQKVPYEEGWQQLATTDENQIRSWAAKYPGCNFGTTSNPDQIIIDLDEKNGKHGITDMRDLEAKHGILPPTKTVKSPTGGIHLYFTTTRQIRNTVGRIAPGIDVRGFLTYVVSPGSVVPDGTYTVMRPGPVAPIPDWFLGLGDAASKTPLARPDDSDTEGSIKEGHRDNEITRWAGVLRGAGLTAEEMEGALITLNRKRCTTPLPDSDILRIVHSIGKKPRGVAAAIADFATDTIPKVKFEVFNARGIIHREIPPPDQFVEAMFDRGDVVGIFAKSKAKKSWFALQLALALATGTPFLHWPIKTPRKVLLFQLEVKRDHYERRLQMMKPELLATLANLDIAHCRGKSIIASDIAAEARARKAEVVFIDPIYPLFQAGENSAEDIRPIVQEFNRIAESGTTLCYIMHDAKGRSGDRELVDRGSGSGIIGRAYDAAFYLDPHSDEDDAIVIRGTCRNYEKPVDATARWRDGLFHLDHGLDPTPKTSFSENRKRNLGTPLSEIAEQVLDAIPPEGIARRDLITRIHGVGQNKLDRCIRTLEYDGRLILETKGKGHSHWLKLPENSGVMGKKLEKTANNTLDDLV